jgi:hypothetical protein
VTNSVIVVAVVAIIAVAAVGALVYYTSSRTGSNTQGSQSSSSGQSTGKTTHQSSQSQTSTTPPPPPSVVIVSGSVSTTGQGTQPTSITFVDSAGTSHPTIVSNGAYSLALQNPSSYDATIQWSGAYSWQSGTVDKGAFALNQGSGGSSTVTANWHAETPDSNVQITGSAVTSGKGTQAVIVSFIGRGGTYNATVSNTNYDRTIPNLDSYSVHIYWTGAYSWQHNVTSAGGVAVSVGAGSSSASQNLQITTPDAVVTISGTAHTNGFGTSPASITFTLLSTGEKFTTSVTNGKWSILSPTLPHTKSRSGIPTSAAAEHVQQTHPTQ